MNHEIDVEEIIAECGELVRNGVRGQHSNSKVIRLCAEIKSLRAQRDAAIKACRAMVKWDDESSNENISYATEEWGLNEVCQMARDALSAEATKGNSDA